MARAREVAAVRLGGLALVLAALLFIAVFSYLAVQFDYPEVLDRPAAEVLPRLIGLGAAGRAVWTLYALIPLLLVPAGVGVWVALRDAAPGAARSAAAFAIVSAFSMMLGLLRWPSIHWHLARAFETATASQRTTLSAVYGGLNSYLGGYVGEFVGELTLNLFFLLTAHAILCSPARSRWLGIAGVAASLIGFAAMLRRVTPLVAGIADANNLALPLWLVVLGIAFIRERTTE
ncbi:MAG: DUF4386 family protein [Candidatus Eisenbacteria bacterium]|uniref:DUF4386 family protein n=1 Tax=Eiseniibacteriota bacterium TaxID=2212470 RepID=A0A849SGL9_UNCEI|nr:DUF4386 family protein [Candidatus Eisenbacteria bacterium]